MAKSLGAEVHTENFDWDEPTIDEEALSRIRTRISSLKPKLITAIHCETPCGSINIVVPEIGRIAKENGSLFCVDAVSSTAGLPVLVDVRNLVPFLPFYIRKMISNRFSRLYCTELWSLKGMGDRFVSRRFAKGVELSSRILAALDLRACLESDSRCEIRWIRCYSPIQNGVGDERVSVHSQLAILGCSGCCTGWY